VHVARAKGTLVFPAKFTLVAAMNPCPCGYYGDTEKECKCGAYEVIRYQKKISGPLLDRIDLQIKVPRIKLEELRKASDSEAQSPKIKKSIENARHFQLERLKSFEGVQTNAEMSPRHLEKFSLLESEAESFLNKLKGARLSPRGYYRLLKTARTIADLAQSEKTKAEHLAEAFSYRLREEV
jgi:magnesium chelatase family protein